LSNPFSNLERELTSINQWFFYSFSALL
jgi:hypothetical protein